MSSFSEIINKDKPVMVDFFATWCGPCKALAPILKQVKDVMADNVSIIKIDIDKNQDLATKLNVRGVPTLILYKNGTQVWRQSGVVSKEQLVSKIKEYL